MAQIDVNLRDIYRVVRKRKWVIIFAPILMAISTYSLTQVPPAIYTSDALVQISRTSTVAGLMTDMVQYSGYDNMATQVTIITSRPVLEGVAKKLNMVKPGGNQEEALQEAFDDLKGRVSAEQRGASDILGIRATASTAEDAIVLANTVVDVYIEKYRATRDQKINDTVEYLRKRSAQVTEEFNQAQHDLFDFRRQESYALARDPNRGLELREKSTQYQQKIDDLTTALDTVKRIRQSKEYDSLPQSYLTIDDGPAHQMLDEATKSAITWMDLRSKRADLLTYQTATAPQVKSLELQIGSEESRLTGRLVNMEGRLQSVLGVAQGNLNALKREEESVNRQPELAAQLDDLTLNAKEKQEQAAILRKQLQDVEVQQREKVEDITVVEKAHAASTIPNPTKTYKALIGALIGLLVGGVFSFILEAMDTSLGTIEDVEQHLNSVVLGIIPHLEKEDVKDRMRLDKGPALSPDQMDRFSRLVTHFDPKSIGSEAYRTLRTNVASIMMKNPSDKVILVSSSMIQEGKTTSVTNLATAFAQGGKRTLLIDADLRRPTVDKTFGINRVPGLTDLLLDTRDPRECYRTIDDIMLGKFGLKLAQATPGLEYLTILPAGRIVDKPTELLTSPALDRLLAEVREKFDVILVDVSPILPVADAFVLAPKMDGIILAYQIGRVARDVLKRTKQRVESVGGKVWGVILNDIQSEIDYRSGDFSYYHYRYDREADQPKSIGDRVKAALKFPKKTKRREKPGNDRRPPAPPSGTASSESGQAKDIMTLTDD